MYSTAGGNSWKKSDLPSPYDNTFLVAISAIGDKRIWVGGAFGDDPASLGGMLWSDDGGLSWRETEPATYGFDIWRISMVGGVK